MGESIMQSTEDRVILWEQWMNSRNTLRKKELDEMKDHLLEEIEYLMTHENLSEEEAFHKAVDTIGKKKELIEEEIKVKQENIKRKWKIVISCMVSLCIVGLSVCTIQYTHQKRSQVANSIPYGYPCDGDIEIPSQTITFRNQGRIHPYKGDVLAIQTSEGTITVTFPKGTILPDDPSIDFSLKTP